MLGVLVVFRIRNLSDLLLKELAIDEPVCGAI